MENCQTNGKRKDNGNNGNYSESSATIPPPPKARLPPYPGRKNRIVRIWEQPQPSNSPGSATKTKGQQETSQDNNCSEKTAGAATTKTHKSKLENVIGQDHGSVSNERVIRLNETKSNSVHEMPTSSPSPPKPYSTSPSDQVPVTPADVSNLTAPSVPVQKQSSNHEPAADSVKMTVVATVASGGEESTDSENEVEPTSNFQRKLSTHKELKTTVSLKEGYLMKQTSSFQRWHPRYFKVKERTLYYAKHEKAQIFDEISLTELTIAETSSKSCKHCFQVITPYRVLTLGTDSRSKMEEWVQAIRAANNTNLYEIGDHANLLSGAHVWYATSHARPTYCNICREQLCGVTSQGLSCEICKFKAHKRCASKALNNCKWTTLASMGKEIIEESDGTLSLPHQWLEGNLPVSAKCEVCERTCGSVLRLQDWRCLWCRVCVHTPCRPIINQKCTVGRISVVPPTALHTIGSDDAWETSRSLQACSPLLVFVNSKSGDHQGLKFLRRFKQLLNPAQVFDLMAGGPRLGLQLFRHFEPFRILVCGGDGSVGWVMSEIDRLDMHRQCQVGVLPLGTGNDLARVLGWGASCDDDAHLPHILEKYEKGTTKMLDRWSVMTFERGVVLNPRLRQGLCLGETSNKPQIAQLFDSEYSVVSHLHNILQSDQHQIVITSAKVLCETVRDMIGKIGASADSEIEEKCATLSQKLDSLLQTLHEETDNVNVAEDESKDSGSAMEEDAKSLGTPSEENQLPCDEPETPTGPLVKKLTRFRQRENLMSRANSLKKAVRQIIEHAEKTLDEQTSSAPVVRPVSLAVVAPIPQIPTATDSDISPSQDTKHKGFGEAEQDLTPSVPHFGSPIDPHLTLPAPTEFADQKCRLRTPSDHEHEHDGSESKVQRDHSQTEKNKNTLPIKIEVDSPSSSTRTPSEAELQSGFEKASLSPPSTSTFLLVPSPGSPSSLAEVSDSSSSKSTGSISTSISRSASPRASRRVSMGSLLKPLEVEIPKSPNSKFSFFDISESGLYLSSISPSSPGKNILGKKQKTLPIVNPLVSHPSWPTIAAGGIVSKVLLANADTICAVASPLMDPEDEEDLMIGFDEKCVMNNYFGIGIDAKITLDFHLKREEHPEKYRSRTKNFMWYGVLGSKEYVQQTFKNLEQRVQLECDGKRLPLPSLQGIVILNIQSFMGGTNFWGGTKEDDCFLAPSFDDKILEVVAVFDSMQMAASRLINLQHHRIAQCNSIKITILGDEPIPIQVDGEAWLQPPGVIKIIHKNRMQMLCRNRALESSLKSWEEKQKQHMGLSPTSTETDDLDKKRHSKRLFSLGQLRDKIKDNRTGSSDDTTPDASSMNAGSSETKSVDEWTGSEIGDWLETLQLGEYRSNFIRHDIQGSELLCLQRRDLKDLGITKVGHIKRILQGIANLHKDLRKSYLMEFCDEQSSQNSLSTKMIHSISQQYLPL